MAITYKVSLIGLYPKEYMKIFNQFSNIELDAWLTEYNSEIEYVKGLRNILPVDHLIFKFPDEQTLTLFKLKWL